MRKPPLPTYVHGRDVPFRPRSTAQVYGPRNTPGTRALPSPMPPYRGAGVTTCTSACTSTTEKYGCKARKKRGRRRQKEKRKHICCWHIEEYALCTEDIIEDSDLHKHALLGHHIPPFSPFSSPFSSPFNGMSFPSWPSSSWLEMLPVLHCCVFCFYQNWLPELHRQ